MRQSATTEPSPTFAGVLAALTQPGQNRPPTRDPDGLDDDVATFSSERVLRGHSRIRKPDPPDPPNLSDHFNDRALTQPAPSERLRIHEVFPPELDSAAEMAPEPARDSSKSHDRKLKSARITMSLSIAEHAQLRARAAEAGLTLSAYLRSCTVEAESLRAEVKDTLAHLRGEAASEDEEAAPAAGSSWFQRLRFWPRWKRSRGIASPDETT